jgi:hypothetical protein
LYRRQDALIATLVLIGVTALGVIALQRFRAAGVRPDFYQSNFEPAVLLACGRGFGITVPPTPAIETFLAVQRDRFDCAEIPASASIRPLTSAAHANWYYMYGAAAAVWRIAGVSWTSLDFLVALMAGIAAAILYGLCRLVTNRAVSAAIAFLLSLSPANLTPLLSLRDYSKAPFVLGAILILALFVWKPMARRERLLLAAGYGIVVAIGYGFRADLIVMVPFGILMVLLFIAPSVGGRRIVAGMTAAVVLLAAFVVTAFPVLSGLKYGGCQYHFALLGLTTPLAAEMRLTSPIYRFGDHLTDSFVDLKVGDYASRIRREPVPSLCSAEYDRSSEELYFGFAKIFPADFVARAYASVLMILRTGLSMPATMQPSPVFSTSGETLAVYQVLARLTSVIGPLGPLLTLAAMVIAFAHSLRLGLAVTSAILFLTGYPAVQFEARHWFHLRFIPWWSGALVATVLWKRRSEAFDWVAIRRGSFSVAAVLIALATALTIIRTVQAQSAQQLFNSYLAAELDPVDVAPIEGDFIPVRWEPTDYGTAPFHRGSDMLVLTLDAATCGSQSPTLHVTYNADAPSHDLSNDIVVAGPKAGSTARVFIPIFWQGIEDQTYLRFSGVRVINAPPTCVSSVAKIRDRAAIAQWLQVDASPGWAERSLYESMRLPRLFNR